MSGKNSIKKISICALFTAIIAALSQVAFPTPVGVSVTLQTFAVAVTAFLLGTKLSAAATVCYCLLGAAGAPVFAGFCGGVGVLLGPSGGFIFAFPIFAVTLSFAVYVNKKIFKLLLCASALSGLYIIGETQFIIVTGNSPYTALTVFFPYFIKDIAVVAAAYFLCLRLRSRIEKSIHRK